MYIRLYDRNPLFIKLMLLCSVLLFDAPARALSTDSSQPIEIEADAAELDDQKGVTIYTGNVVVVQGSIRMTGEKMTVHYTKNDDLDTVVLTGNPATYKQLPDNSQIHDEAEASRMEYYGLKNLIILIDNAVVKQEDLRFSGSRIEYDTVKSQIKARGEAKSEAAGDASTDQTGSGRVKITIKPKKKQEEQPAPE